MRILLCIVIILTATPALGLTIIPGEDEDLYGMDTEAGSGRHLGTPDSDVCVVDDLADTNTGSYNAGDDRYEGTFRYCIEDVSGPKVIVFEVSGYITPTSLLKLGRNSGGSLDDSLCDYTTIAGQTAPSPGITIKGARFVIDRGCDNVLIQHLRFRSGDTPVGAQESWDAFAIDDHTPYPTNIVIDHCSFSWAIDEIADSDGNYVTWINNIISEPLDCNEHDENCHGVGLLIRGGVSDKSQYVAIVKNLFSHADHRVPSLYGGKAIIVNNYIYDWEKGIQVTDYQEGPMFVSIIANYIEWTDAAQTEKFMDLWIGHKAASRVFIGEDNYLNDAIETDPWNSANIKQCNTWSSCTDVPGVNRAASKEDAAWPSGYAVEYTAAEAKTYVLANVGARPADRDVVDTRVVAQATAVSRTSAWIDSVTRNNSDCVGSQDPLACCTGSGTGTCVQVAEGGWPTLTENTRALTIPSNPHTVQASGYTALEEWLHGHSDAVEDLAGPPIDGVTIN
jgi:pectate lyase